MNEVAKGTTPGSSGWAKRACTLAALVVVAALGLYAPAQADDKIGLAVAGPSQVTMPDGAPMHISVSPPENVDIGDVATVVYDHNYNYVGGCSADCTYTAMPWLLESGSHQVVETFHLRAYGSNQTTSPFVTKTVTFDPPNWQASLDMPAEVSMPDPIPVTLQVTPAISSPHTLDVFDNVTGAWTGVSCATAVSCDRSIGTGWLGGAPVTKHYRATLAHGDITMASDEKTVVIYPPNLGVTVWGPSIVLPGQSYTIRVTNTYNRWTPYTIVLRNGNGGVVGWCSVDSSTCEFTITAGPAGTAQSYYVDVSDGGSTITQTSVLKVESTDPQTLGPGGGGSDRVDIDALAAMFGSASAVCGALLFYPGTHNANSSTTDQWLACDAAAQTSGSAAVAIRAALGAMAGVGLAEGGQSLLSWLQHYAWVNYGNNPPPSTPADPPPNPPSPPATTPSSVASQIDALATDLMAANAALATAGVVTATAVAKACLFQTSKPGLSADLCRRLPIFVPGSDHPEATNHRIEALASWPAWVRLTRRVGPRDRWYASQPECAGSGGGLDCDEFPEGKTYQGGSRGAATKRPSLKVINGVDNQGLGGALGNFYVTCGITDGQAFLVVPLPPVLGIPTQKRICNS